MASQIFPTNFILIIFSDSCMEIANIFINSTKYSEIMPWLMEQKIFCVKTYYEAKSFKIVQARYNRKFNFNTFPIKSQIFKLFKNFKAYGTCEDRRATGYSPCGSSITIRTPENVTRVQESVGRIPTTSL
jgi:hypothetical protein